MRSTLTDPPVASFTTYRLIGTQHETGLMVKVAPPEKRYKNKDWAIPIGINYQKQLSSKVYANSGIEYLLGLTNSFSENGISKFGVLSEFDNSKQSRLSFNIGFGFSLTK